MQTIRSSARHIRRAALSTPVLSAILALILLATTAVAQDATPKPPMVYQTFFLHHAVEQNQATEMQQVLRNVLPRSRIIYVGQQNAICIQATADDMATAQKIIADLDRSIATWRLTFTLTETEGGHAEGTPQRVAVVVTQGSKTNLKLGNKVPVVTGGSGADPSPSSSQVQYVDVGLNIYAKIDGASDTPLLETKIEQSNVADERSGIGTQDPLIHQTSLDEELNLIEARALTIGTLDLPGSTRQEKIEVTAERVTE
jgi:type II secretory pathway component GspD/PulD (secretin)